MAGLKTDEERCRVLAWLHNSYGPKFDLASAMSMLARPIFKGEVGEQIPPNTAAGNGASGHTE